MADKARSQALKEFREDLTRIAEYASGNALEIRQLILLHGWAVERCAAEGDVPEETTILARLDYYQELLDRVGNGTGDCTMRLANLEGAERSKEETQPDG